MDTREKDELQRLIATKASTSISAINAIMLGLVAGIVTGKQIGRAHV